MNELCQLAPVEQVAMVLGIISIVLLCIYFVFHTFSYIIETYEAAKKINKGKK